MSKLLFKFYVGDSLKSEITIHLNLSPARKEKRYWDGEKTVFVVLLGSSVALPCVNRRPLWREGLQEDQQQVAHWDFQPPGVRPDGAERLVDLYASGERREYGSLFSRNKMNVADDAFSVGDFSLSIAELAPVHRGLYICHLHHHYCGLHERRIFRLTVGPPLPHELTAAPRIVPNDEPKPSKTLLITQPSKMSTGIRAKFRISQKFSHCGFLLKMFTF